MKLAACLAFLAGPIAAETNKNPFMRCTFDNGRIVVLAGDVNTLEWREGDFVARVISETQVTHDPILTFITPWAEPKRIDVFVGWFEANAPEIEIGEALLSRTVISLKGKMESEAIAGQCEDFFG